MNGQDYNRRNGDEIEMDERNGDHRRSEHRKSGHTSDHESEHKGDHRHSEHMKSGHRSEHEHSGDHESEHKDEHRHSEHRRSGHRSDHGSEHRSDSYKHKHTLDTGDHNGRRRSRSRSPRPVRDEWKNPTGSLKRGELDSLDIDSCGNAPLVRRQSSSDDHAYALIREASYKKDPRRASEPVNKSRYPPPPELETYPTQPRSFLWLAMLTAIVNIVFGIIALVCAITSDNAWAAGKREEAKKRGRYALGICIMGIICTAIIIIAVPVSYKYMYPS